MSYCTCRNREAMMNKLAMSYWGNKNETTQISNQLPHLYAWGKKHCHKKYHYNIIASVCSSKHDNNGMRVWMWIEGSVSRWMDAGQGSQEGQGLIRGEEEMGVCLRVQRHSQGLLYVIHNTAMSQKNPSLALSPETHLISRPLYWAQPWPLSLSLSLSLSLWNKDAGMQSERARKPCSPGSTHAVWMNIQCKRKEATGCMDILEAMDTRG